MNCDKCGAPAAPLFTGSYCTASCDKPVPQAAPYADFGNTDENDTDPGFGYSLPDTDWWSVYTIENINGTLFGHPMWFREQDYAGWCKYYACMSLFLVPTVQRQQGKPGKVSQSPGHPGPYVPAPNYYCNPRP